MGRKTKRIHLLKECDDNKARSGKFKERSSDSKKNLPTQIIELTKPQSHQILKSYYKNTDKIQVEKHQIYPLFLLGVIQ